MIPSYLGTVFSEKADVLYHGSMTVLETFSAGVLLLPTGQIIACDPLAGPVRRPFVPKVRPGRYPVTLHLIESENLVALAVVRLNKTPTVTWELALTADDDRSSLKEGDLCGYGVDSGTGCFMDAHAFRALNRKMEKNENYFERIISEMSGDRFSRFPFTNMMLTHKVPSNMIAFSTGAGDDVYPSFFGEPDA